MIRFSPLVCDTMHKLKRLFLDCGFRMVCDSRKVSLSFAYKDHAFYFDFNRVTNPSYLLVEYDCMEYDVHGVGRLRLVWSRKYSLYGEDSVYHMNEADASHLKDAVLKCLHNAGLLRSPTGGGINADI